MKTRNKALLLSLCAVLLVAVSVLGTMAYLTDTDDVKNTFTVGSVALKLDETKVDVQGNPVGSGERTEDGNEYHLLPGHTYQKDPTVTVLKGSDRSYIRMMVTVNFSKELDEIFAPAGAKLTDIFDSYDPGIWSLTGVSEDDENNTRTYEFRYKDTVEAINQDVALVALFKNITVPDTITNEQLATLVTKGEDGTITDQLTISVEAHAIQADGFEDADEAWEAFN